MNITAWFPIGTKPVHIGMYERTSEYTGMIVYSWWDGKWFGANMSCSCESCMEYSCENISDYQIAPWRGQDEPIKNIPEE